MPKTAKKPAKRAQYSPETWSTIRALCESGAFKSQSELHQHCTRILRSCPSLDAIKKKAAREGWDKHDQDEKKEEEKKKNFVEIFAELGMNDQKAAALIVEGMTAGGDIGEKVVRRILERGPDLLSEDGQKAMMAAIGEFSTQLKIRNLFVEKYLKITGGYAPEKLKLVHKDGDLEKKHPYGDLTEDELRQRVLKIREKFLK